MSHVLITGANKGIGLEFAKQYLSRGNNVIACCRNPSTANELQQLVDTRLDVLSLDVSDESAIERLPALLAGRKVSLFINNAGAYGAGQSLDQVQTSEWIAVMKVNTIAPLLVARAILPSMEEGGKLAFLSSKMGSIADNSSGSVYIYRTSKTALNQVVRSLSYDLSPLGLPVVALHPGWVKTDMGGPNALIDTKTSVSGMVSVIDCLDLAKSGKFFNYQGVQIPW